MKLEELKRLPTDDKRKVIQFLIDDLRDTGENVESLSTDVNKRAREALAEIDPDQELLTQEQMWAEVTRLRNERRSNDG